MDKSRLILEYIRVKSRYPEFRLSERKGQMVWQGSLVVAVAGVDSEPLELRIAYPEEFPTAPPTVEVLSPHLNPADVGHSWHRWAKGNVCYIRPRDWGISTCADEIVEKVTDWYHNYIAVKRGLIDRMPNVGRATVESA